MNKEENVKQVSELKAPTIPGVHFRMLCMTGPNKGLAYYLLGKRIVIGRGEHTDIHIVDPKISREHAELSFSDNGYIVTDLGAQNGIIIDDNRIKQKRLLDNDKVVIGQTVFRYNIFDIQEQRQENLDETSTALVEIEEENKPAIKNVRSKLQFKAELPQSRATEKTEAPLQNSEKAKKNKMLVTIIGLLVIFYVLFGQDDKPKMRAGNRNGNTDGDTLDSPIKKNLSEDAEAKKKLESYLHSGRREFREGNYFRAMEDFRLALLLSPNNGQASFYLNKAKQRLDEEIEKNFDKAKQESEAKKFQAAIISYCSVIQLIQNYPEDSRYKSAQTKISALESELGMEKGEIKCLEEKSVDPKN